MTRAQLALYIATAAAVHARLCASATFRKKPQAAAHTAAIHARAAVAEARINSKRTSR